MDWRTNVALSEVAKDAGVLLLGVLLPVGFTLARGADAAVIVNLLHVLGDILAVAAGVAALVSWRVIGHAFTAWFGIAMVDLGLLGLVNGGTPVIGQLDPLQSVSASSLGTVVVTALTGVIAWKALRTEEVDSSLAPMTLFALTALGGVCLLGLISLAGAHGFLGGTLLSQNVASAAQAVASAIWLAAAVAAARAHVSGRVVQSWVPAVFGLLGIGHLTRIAFPTQPAVAIADNAIVLAGLALAMAAALWELRWMLRSQDRLSLSLRLDLNQLHQQMEHEQASLEERLHDLRNAVGALRTADSTLRRYAGHLDDQARNHLADALTAELSRLQTLIEPSRRPSSSDFALEEAIAPIAEVERSYGATIDLRLGGVRANGDAVAVGQVVQNLLVNSRHYAANSPVLVTAESLADRVEVKVEDFGPGIPEHERRSIFTRGTRGTTSEGTAGDGIGLFVAARLMTEMGGNLRLADTGDSRGACFVLELPAVSAPAPLPLAAEGEWLRPAS